MSTMTELASQAFLDQLCAHLDALRAFAARGGASDPPPAPGLPIGSLAPEAWERARAVLTDISEVEQRLAQLRAQQVQEASYLAAHRQQHHPIE